MSTPTIEVTHLSKHYKVPTRDEGLKAAAKSLFKRTYKTVKAVDDISFTIQHGEVVGFLGPNGAGKTTTLKMLSGLLFPTEGSPRVLGYEPSKRQPEFLQQITMVMGNRQQLRWDLPALDSFNLQRAVYGLSRAEFEKTRDEFVELLEIKDLVKKPIRNFVEEYNRRYGATVLLTSHYMADVEALCRRIIVIHNGKLLFDGDLSALMVRFSAFKTIGVTTNGGTRSWSQYGEVLHQDMGHVTLRIPREKTPDVTARILAEQQVDDLTVEDPPIEDVIEKVFNLKSAEGERT